MGNFVGKPTGNETQMPGAFLVHNRTILYAHRANNAGDHPDLARVAALAADCAALLCPAFEAIRVEHLFANTGNERTLRAWAAIETREVEMLVPVWFLLFLVFYCFSNFIVFNVFYCRGLSQCS